MKSLNVKLPLSVMNELDNRGQLNPSSITSIIIINLHKADNMEDRPISEVTSNYVFKVPSDLHRIIKLKAIEKDLPMNELIGRLLSNYYKGDEYGEVQAY